jgi:hypothetical protein
MLKTTNFTEKQIAKMGLTLDELNAIKLAAYHTWQGIGADCEACLGKPLSVPAMVEVTIDADHMLSHGNPRGNGMDPALYGKFKTLPYSTMKKIVREAIA